MRKIEYKNKLENGEHYALIKGIKHWYKVAGSQHGSVPIVIIHGGPGGNNYVFERTIGPYLENFTTVIYYEQRGCGRSDAPIDIEAYSIPLLLSDLEDLCNELGVKKIIPLGYSFGGELALEFAIAFPNRVEKIIAQAPSIFSEHKRILFTQIHGFEKIADEDNKEKIREIINSTSDVEEKCSRIWDFVDTKTVDRFLFHNAKYAQLNRNLWHESELYNTGLMMKALLKEKNQTSLMDNLSAIKVPVLIITGLYDKNVGVDLNRDIASKISQCNFMIFDKSAHFPDIEETEKYSNVVKEFVLYN
jgi:proline iminopeptidase